MSINNHFMQTVVDKLEDLILIVDDNGKIVFKNIAMDESSKISGHNTMIQENANFFELLEATHNEKELTLIQQVLRGEMEEVYEEIPGQTGSKPYWYAFRVFKTTLPNNRTGAIIIYSIITSKVIANSEITNILASMTDAFFSVDPNWNITYFNISAKKLLNKLQQNIKGDPNFDEIPKIIEADLFPVLQKIMNEKSTIQEELFIPQLGSWLEIKAFPRIEGGVSVFFHQIDSRKETEDKLHSYAYYDFLTNLPNRRMTYDIIQKNIDNNMPFSIFYINVDGFKSVNDVYGHAHGDTLLVKVANLLQQTIQPPKTLTRVGGDEFMIFTDEVDKEELSKIADKIISSFQDLHEASSVPTISMGIARFPNDAPNSDSLFRYSNIAMSYAKRVKHNSYNFFEANMVDKLERQVVLENEMAGDLKDTTIQFVVQPQYCIASKEVIGIEVLSRWLHPKYGYISPPDFIEIAEKTGQIGSLTKYLLTEIFSHTSRWITEYGFNKIIAVNITPKLLANAPFFQELIQLLEDYQIPPHLLEIEITENAELITTTTIQDNLALCRKLGIKVSLDDFGTGYSKLADLVAFHIDKIKIDKYFVDKIGEETSAEHILQTFMDLAKGLKCEILAEGVETKEQVDHLTALGVNFFQGYYFSKPITIDDFEKNYIQAEYKIIHS
ncbi:EAL domain-containing protein [Psychrobacillus sp.]|uniref:sensor domain-containing protein n=1 Tax=Psychrobacillus sp. TaxID=1871623 RepID=UPI0028BEF21E|nr:EAL domain-containing protein [Psychrobacillus sp.]